MILINNVRHYVDKKVRCTHSFMRKADAKVQKNAGSYSIFIQKFSRFFEKHHLFF